MTFIKFNRNNKLGISSIDEQHKQIYNIVNNLYKLKDAGRTKISKEFKLLLSKFKEHFATEEQFMKDNNVPSLFSHRLEHQRAFDKYTSYFETYKTNKEPFDVEILNSLKTWLHNHAEIKDNKLKQYAKK